MPNAELPFQQTPPVDEKQVDCVEVYLPKSIQFLSELYQLLRDKTTNRLGSLVLDGCTVGRCRRLAPHLWLPSCWDT